MNGVLGLNWSGEHPEYGEMNEIATALKTQDSQF